MEKKKRQYSWWNDKKTVPYQAVSRDRWEITAKGEIWTSKIQKAETNSEFITSVMIMRNESVRKKEIKTDIIV